MPLRAPAMLPPGGCAIDALPIIFAFRRAARHTRCRHCRARRHMAAMGLAYAIDDGIYEAELRRQLPAFQHNTHVSLSPLHSLVYIYSLKYLSIIALAPRRQLKLLRSALMRDTAGTILSSFSGIYYYRQSPQFLFQYLVSF